MQAVQPSSSSMRHDQQEPRPTRAAPHSLHWPHKHGCITFIFVQQCSQCKLCGAAVSLVVAPAGHISLRWMAALPASVAPHRYQPTSPLTARCRPAPGKGCHTVDNAKKRSKRAIWARNPRRGGPLPTRYQPATGPFPACCRSAPGPLPARCTARYHPATP